MVRVPAVGEATGGSEISHDRQVHEDDVIGRHGEVVHHHRPRQVDRGGAGQRSVAAEPEVVDLRLVRPDGERQHLARTRADLRMRGEVVHRAVEVDRTDGVEVGGHLVRAVVLLESQDAPPVDHHVGVGRGAIWIVGVGRRPGQPGRAHPAAAVPHRSATAQQQAVKHSLAQEPVRRVAAGRVGPGMDQHPVQFGGDPATHRKVERLGLVGEGAVIAP